MTFSLFGLQIIPAPLLEPDFFRVGDWRNAQATATPEYLCGRVIGNRMYAHPELIEAIKKGVERELTLPNRLDF